MNQQADMIEVSCLGKMRKMESPPKQETHRRDADDMTKHKAIKDPNDNPKGRICQLK